MPQPLLAAILHLSAAAASAAEGPGLVLMLRVLGALLVGPLLFWLLRDEAGPESPGWKSARLDFLRRMGFAALGAAVFFGLSQRWVPEEASPNAGRGFEALYKGVLTLRMSQSWMSALAETPEGAGSLKEATAQLRKASELVPESSAYRRTYGVALAADGDYPAAGKTLTESARLLARRAPERAQAEEALWKRLFGGAVPTLADLAAARAEVQRLKLGWLGRVALLSAYQRRGERAAPEDLREEVAAEANRYAADLFGIAAAFFLIAQLALVALVVGVVLIVTRALRRIEVPLHPVAPILWESFILLLALNFMPVLWLAGGRRPTPETQPGLLAALLVAQDVIQLLAVVYLWRRLKGRGLGLGEAGLRSANVGLDVGIGLGAAVLLTPATMLLNIVTQQLTNRFFPHIAPPYHPLEGLSATVTSPEIRLAMFVAAAIGAPFFEEIFFRGALFGALWRRHGRWPGILGSAAFFAILHPQLPLGFLPIAALGGAFAALYAWRGSLIPGIVAHAFNNGLIFLVLGRIFPASG